MIKLVNINGLYYLKGYEQIINLFGESEFLKLFLSKNEVLLFGCNWYDDLTENFLNIKDPYLNQVYQELSDFFIEDIAILKQDKLTKRFMEQRTVFINKEWLLPFNKPKDFNEIRWFLPNDDEINKAISINQNYTCIVIEKDVAFEEFKCLIHCFDDDEGKSLLIINNREDSHFHACVLPAIQKKVNIDFS